MASKTSLFVALNLLLFALATASQLEVGKCSNTLKLGVCATVLDGLINIKLGTPPKEPCCGLIHGLANLEAAACVCAALKAHILGIHLHLPISLNLLLNYCGKQVPEGFQCP
ncbi:hypothetical protein Taro_013758 [Colocasia esculenta]|uniref:Bifunctional inhibitor/plant lipid transfer protein/seed storage helical domain-containing protein n=1 Tax=Colocasia esculenta TaxID=4460 RepID=A0A843UGE9_COLES|nr:hypothetical protein [Colocasia esculenta]